MMFLQSLLVIAVWFAFLPIIALGLGNGNENEIHEDRTPRESLVELEQKILDILKDKNNKNHHDSQRRTNKETTETTETATATETATTERKAIVGGGFSDIYRYPYMVTLRYYSNTHTCGGSLIAPDIVLTAAHCYSPAWGQPKVIVGDYDFNDPNDGGEMFDVKLLVSHPDYNDLTLEHDILLFQLVDNQKSTHAPVKINDNGSVPSAMYDPLTVIGWGTIDPGGNTAATILKETTLEYVPNNVCGQGAGIICAQDLDGTHDEDACKGDSGGPLIVKGSDAASDVQVALVSAGPFPCDQPFPGIYTRISHYFYWIETWICENSVYPSSDFNCHNRTMPPSISYTPTLSPSITSSPTIQRVPFTLVIQLDQYPGEVLWGIYEHNTTNRVEANLEGYPLQKANQIVFENFKLEPNTLFDFYIYDVHGDGICCFFGNGYYALYYGTATSSDQLLESNQLFQESGDYGRSHILSFFSGVPTAPPSLSPSISAAPTISFAPSVSPTISFSPSVSNVEVTIIIRFDQYPYTVGWAIFDENVDITPTAVPIASNFGYSSSMQMGFAYETVQLKSNANYQFQIYDINADGICCYQGSGYYMLYYGAVSDSTKHLMVEEKQMLFSMGDFGFSRIHQFSTQLPSDYTKAPTPTPIHQQFITIVIQFDTFPFEVGYKVVARDGSMTYLDKPTGSYTVSYNQRVEERVYLPHSTKLMMIVQDSYGDGILGGGIKVYEGPVSDGNLIKSFTGEFSYSTIYFELEYRTQHPSISPTTNPTNSPLPSYQPSMTPTISPIPAPTTTRSNGPVSSCMLLPTLQYLGLPLVITSTLLSLY